MTHGASLDKRLLDALDDAFDQPSSDRVAWVKKTYADDRALLARLLTRLSVDATLDSALRTGGASAYVEEEATPEKVGAYRIVSLLGRGGMGAVYTATRDTGDFDHFVAIKIIRPGVLNDDLVERFQNERQILAQLNHPNIARLFDGGAMPDGSPYIVMEYVDGVPITEWVKKNDLAIADRLSIFSEACRAVQHAHQNLIVHRDITPTNVLVSHDGTAKLIDFGIARPQEGDRSGNPGASRKTESLTFTPGYAAPERRMGAPTSTLSDIYSLGVLLRDVLNERNIGADLASIINKATAVDPAHRYSSVGALLDDLEQFTAGLPVDAHDGGRFYRLAKHVSRRRLVVSAGAIALAGLLTAFGVTLFQYQRAEAALGRANERFEQARTLSRSLIFETYDEFSGISGTLEARRKLANLVNVYVDELASDERAPNDILYDIGVMKSRLSDVYGGIGLSNLGEIERSRMLLNAAADTLDQIYQAEPQNTEVLAELVFAKRTVSMQHLFYGKDMDAALQVNQEVLDLAKAGVALGDENEQTLLRHFWSGRTDQLQILRDRNETATALERVQQWRTELDDVMIARLGGGEEMAAYLSVQQAELLNNATRNEEVATVIDYAIEYRREQLAASPKNYYQKTQLVTALTQLARAHVAQGEIERMLAVSAEIVALTREIKAENPDDVRGSDELTTALQQQSRHLLKAGNIDDARIAAAEALKVAQGLYASFPDDVYYRDILVDAIVSTIDVDLYPEKRCDQSLDASALLNRAMVRLPSDPALRTSVSAKITKC